MNVREKLEAGFYKREVFVDLLREDLWQEHEIVDTAVEELVWELVRAEAYDLDEVVRLYEKLAAIVRVVERGRELNHAEA